MKIKVIKESASAKLSLNDSVKDWYKEKYADARESDYEQVVDVDEGVVELREGVIGNGNKLFYAIYHSGDWDVADDDEWYDGNEAIGVMIRANSKEEAEQLLRDEGVRGDIQIFEESLKNNGKTLLPKREELNKSLDITSDNLAVSVRDEIKKAFNRYMKKEGYSEKEIKDWYQPHIKTQFYEEYFDDGADALFVEFRAEMGYEELSDVAHYLNKTIQKFDKEAYFEPVTSGILQAVIAGPAPKKK